jgi:hypothetical protein
MRKSAALAADISEHRALTEARLTALLTRTGSYATLDNIRNIIFNENDTKHPSEYFADLINLFNASRSRIDIGDILPIIQDAWNYFPHRSRGGLCPAELMLQPLSRGKSRRVPIPQNVSAPQPAPVKATPSGRLRRP